MTTEVLRDQKVWLDGYDLSGVMNSVSIEASIEALDATTLGQNTRINKAGLRTVAIALQGFFDASPDQALHASIGVTDKPLLIASKHTIGSPSYMLKPMIGSYNLQGDQGDMFEFALEAATSSKLVRGTLMENQSGQDTTGEGTGRQLGAIAAGQKLYAGLHVTGVSGTSPTLDVTIESDDNASFTSPTTRVTFNQATAIGGQWIELNGAITDDYWRAVYTISGTGAAVSFAVALGIS